MKRFALYVLLALGLIAGLAAFQNSSLLAPKLTERPVLLAHRGLAQTYSAEGIDAATCTATRIDPPEHRYIENTIASMEAAFAAGADIVEIDVHPTRDGQFAVFHDWTLECRTNGAGTTRDKTMAELKALDIGHGYTADGGKSFPLRGQGIGLMPSLDEVLDRLPNQRLLINVKSRDAQEGRSLAQRLSQLPPERLARLMVYGGEPPVAALREALPSLVTMSAPAEKRCLIRYLAMGWAGITPDECAKQLLLIPSNYTKWLWGWPERFTARMRAVGSEVIVAGPLVGGEVSTGIDRAEDLARLGRPLPGIWTNRIDRIAPLVKAATQ